MAAKCQKIPDFDGIVENFSARIVDDRHMDGAQGPKQTFATTQVDTAVSGGGRGPAKGNMRMASPELVEAVLASTEIHLRVLRKSFGLTDMWDGILRKYLDDFGPVVLGA